MVSEQKIIVYFGPGMCIPGGPFSPEIQSNARYISFENLGSWQGSVARDFYNHKPFGELRIQSATNTRLPEGSVDEIHLYNILGDFRIDNPYDFLLEAARIVNKSGSIYVGETLTPVMGPIHKTIPFLEGLGLDVDIMMHLTPLEEITAEQVALIKRLRGLFGGGNHNGIDKDSYILRAYRQ